MLKSQVFEVLFVFISGVSGFVLNKDLIHHLMDDQELRYYFGTESKFHVPDYELVKIAAQVKSNESHVDDNVFNLNFKAFEDDLFFKLKLNKNLVSPFMRFAESYDNGVKELYGRSRECHYLHVDDDTTAALSGCDGRDIVKQK